MSGGAHRDRERGAVDPDLERLLDRHEILLAVAHEGVSKIPLAGA